MHCSGFTRKTEKRSSLYVHLPADHTLLRQLDATRTLPRYFPSTYGSIAHGLIPNCRVGDVAPISILPYHPMPCRRRKALPASLLAVISHVSLSPPLAKAGGNGVVNCCLCHSHLVLVCLLTLGFRKRDLVFQAVSHLRPCICAFMTGAGSIASSHCFMSQCFCSLRLASKYGFCVMPAVLYLYLDFGGF